ncbi:ABC transporter ATP-binding protein [Jatrophihabitans telluris]|uniref:ABC transporter ATP-binding protein n=1 Tax=Jatrophihabitans telluris TaxID=2038343 RepID=A0ABY4QVU9_9ACTN|nr:ABC transporter ATP-binding protein [Jatrophihabitans telluris]UQX87099.1 ABC transporter ATP-binding protein [Jatrophihabitans telluris]
MRRLTVRYRGSDHAALTDVGFSVLPAQMVALVGRSGSGKSTTARAITALLPRAVQLDGSILVGGQEILGVGPDRSAPNIALISQNADRALNPTMRIGQQLVEAQRARGCPRRVARARSVELLELMRFDDPNRVYRSYPDQLSGGMRQRALISIALASNPRVLIADEATTALDVETQRHMMDLLASLRQDLSMAVLLISHDANLVAAYADDVVELRDGRVVQRATERLAETGGTQPPRPGPAVVGPFVDPTGSFVEGTPLVELVNISHRFDGPRRGTSPTVALSDVSLTVRRGETLTLIGASGAGKTTLAHSILHSPPPTSGHVSIDGVDPTTLPAKVRPWQRASVQLIFQNRGAAFDPTWTVFRIVSEPLRVNHSGTRLERRARVRETLDRVGLPWLIFSSLRRSQLSGGQLQLLALARALAPLPELIICDEAFSAMDATTRTRALDVLTQFQREQGCSYLFITHDLDLAAAVSDRVAVLYRGQLCEVGPAARIFNAPTHPYSHGLTGRDSAPNQAGLTNPAANPAGRDDDTGCIFRSRCPRAQAICGQLRPRLRAVSASHEVACHFPYVP